MLAGSSPHDARRSIPVTTLRYCRQGCSAASSARKGTFLRRSARLKSIEYRVWWTAQPKTLASFNVRKKKGLSLPCRTPNGLALSWGTLKNRVNGLVPAHQEILGASCHATLHGFYRAAKPLWLRRLLWASYLKVLEISVRTCHTGLAELILGQNTWKYYVL